MTELERLRETGTKEYERMVRLYTEAFPADERRDSEDLERRIERGDIALHLIMHDGQQAGFITTWNLGEVTYVEHFATEPWARGRGIGRGALEIMKTQSEKPLLLEVEPPETGDMATRRIGFYRRCGFDVVSTDYVQPPYGPGKNAVALYLMATTANPDLQHIVRELHKRVYGVKEE